MAGKYSRTNRNGTQTWYISWRAEGQLRRQRLGPVTEPEAEAARLAKERALTASAAAGPPFADWSVEYAHWRAAEYPRSYYRVEQALRCHLIPHFGATPLLAIRRDQIEAYKANRRAAGITAGTLIKELRILQAVLNAAVAFERIPHNPIAHIRHPQDLVSRPPRWYTAAELAALYAAELQPQPCAAPEAAELHRRYRWTWQLMAHTGARRGEAMHIAWAHIGADEIRIISEPDAPTKSGKWRVVPKSRGAAEALDALAAPAAAPWSDPALILPRIRPESISRAFARTAERANIGGGIHSLRHTFCAKLVQAGRPLREVQQLAGHASITTTERYAHLAPGAHQRARDALDAD
jgi:integrase